MKTFCGVLLSDYVWEVDLFRRFPNIIFDLCLEMQWKKGKEHSRYIMTAICILGWKIIEINIHKVVTAENIYSDERFL